MISNGKALLSLEEQYSLLMNSRILKLLLVIKKKI